MGEGEGGGGGGGKSGAIHTGVGLVIFIALCVFGLQIYLNKPADRPIVACWMPYQAVRMVIVELPKMVLPRDQDIPLKNSRRAVMFNYACICGLQNSSLLNPKREDNGRVNCK
jgi:hypothetical protein